MEKFKMIMSKFWRLGQKLFGYNRQTGEVEKMVFALEERVRLLEERYGRERDGPGPTPVIVEQLYVDQLTVDKVELNNNISSLGISELSGVLNIGANYGGGFPPQKNGSGKWQGHSPGENGSGKWQAPSPQENGSGKGQVPPPVENEKEERTAPSFREKGRGQGQVPRAQEKKAGRKTDTLQRNNEREGKLNTPQREQKREAKPEAPRRGEGTGRGKSPLPGGAEAKKKRPTQGTGPKYNVKYKETKTAAGT